MQFPKPTHREEFVNFYKLKNTLNKYEEAGIIEKVDQPMPWVHNLVVIEKCDGSLRLVIDPENLNDLIY